ncbi:hypothetical protein [Nonomuraea sp. NEAU-A123]|uniref:hypothetical protein n=1 Tax=Nonomuraea sp. NEAU-A123 TaxID=2839649 RepID=UPI001BE3E462|nr:hypothetical protein [Nonomuraea sp. NEAU-A123]MBT2225226.1 hypothetical protein [Nonomuraea sp. NEAU-A123]
MSRSTLLSLSLVTATSLAVVSLPATPAYADGVTSHSASAYGCTITAHGSWRSAANTFTFYATGSCGANRFGVLRCWPVHRHTLYWHNHEGDARRTSVNGRSFRLPAKTVHGTNGDTYKINCKYQWDSNRSVGVETRGFTL